MFVVNTPVALTFTRAKNSAPSVITYIRVYKPDNDIDDVNIVVNTLPTSTVTGLLTFNYTPLQVGNYTFEVLESTSPYKLVHTFYLPVVSNDATYSTIIYT